MNAETKVTGTDLAVAVETDPGLALVNPDAFEAWLIDLRARVEGLDHDVSRAKNRDAIRSAAADIRKEKAKYDRSRLELTKGYREMTAKVNEAGKDIDAKLEALAVQVRAPLTEWEDREKARVERCKAVIADIHGAAIVTLDDTSESVRERGMRIWAIEISDDFGDQAGEAEQAKSATISTLQSALARLKREEADTAELAELRAKAAAREEADRIAEEEAKAARIEAERVENERIAAGRAEAARLAKIEADKEAARMAEELRIAQIERARKDAAEQAQRDAERAAQIERDRIQAEHAAQLAAEKKRADDLAAAEAKRVAAEAAEAAEAAARAKKRDHRAKVMGAAKIAIMAACTPPLSEAEGIAIVKAIVAGNIPYVSLEF